MTSGRLAAVLAMTGMSLLFGASFVGTKIGLECFTPAQLIFLRFALATGIFWALTPWLKPGSVDREGRRKVFVMALLEPGAYFFLEAMGIQRTLASTAAILISTIPLFVLLLEALWLRVRIVPPEALLILLSLGGVFLLVTAGGVDKAIGGSLPGNLLILGAALAASVYTVMARRLLMRYSTVGVTRLQSLYSTLLYLPFAAWDWATRPALPPSPRGWMALGYLGVGCSFLAYLLLNYSLSQVKASIVSAFCNVIPVVGTLLAVFLLDEQLYPMQAAGAVVTIGCTTLLTMRHASGQAVPAGG